MVLVRNPLQPLRRYYGRALLVQCEVLGESHLDVGDTYTSMGNVAESARACSCELPIHASRSCHSSFRLLAGQFWVGKFGCTSRKSLKKRCGCSFSLCKCVLVTETRSPRLLRSTTPTATTQRRCTTTARLWRSGAGSSATSTRMYCPAPQSTLNPKL